MDKFLERLENSGWLAVVLKTLDAACIAAQLLDKEKTPVLIEGMDAALIISSLVQIILNPDCRTVRGFIALIDREFIQGGFPFSTRHRYGGYSPNRSKQTVPSFLLFLDCVYQLHYQFTCSFEFKTQLLVMLCENSYFSQYGTFLGDCERERETLGVYTKTVSYWTHLFRPELMKNILSPLYDPNSQVIWPSVAPCSLVLWSEFYMRWTIDQTFIEQIENIVNTKITQEKELRTKVIKLRKELMDLQKEYFETQVNGNNLISNE
uniref:CSON004597 protein n=1 Tax=Culicoides sonorensis TaxID=179676 RepID=A0A336LTX7_CULSO